MPEVLSCPLIRGEGGVDNRIDVSQREYEYRVSPWRGVLQKDKACPIARLCSDTTLVNVTHNEPFCVE